MQGLVVVLPTYEHSALRDWLRAHRIRADEAGGVLIIANLDGLLRLSGSTRRLSKEERALVKVGRTRFNADPDPLLPGIPQLPDQLVDQLHALIGNQRSVPPDTPLGDLSPIPSMTIDPQAEWLKDPLGGALHALLTDVCEALGDVGVDAEPGLGLGAIRGDEILAACVHVHDPSRLYQLMEEEASE